MNTFLLLKSFHIIFMVTWFAGLFYLPRLFVYHAMPENHNHRPLLHIMERRLFIMTSIGAVLTTILGIALIMAANGYQFKQGWFHAKLTLVALLFIYHGLCLQHMRRLNNPQKKQRTHTFYRWFNEVPSVLLIAIVLLVVLKAF